MLLEAFLSAMMRFLFGRTSSSNTQKVLWALQELGLEYDLVPTSRRLGPNSQHLVKFSGGEPFGEPAGFVEHAGPGRAIPVLVDIPNISIWESNTIVRYLAQKYGPSLLYDGTAEGMAEASSWMASAHMQCPQPMQTAGGSLACRREHCRRVHGRREILS